LPTREQAAFMTAFLSADKLSGRACNISFAVASEIARLCHL